MRNGRVAACMMMAAAWAGVGVGCSSGPPEATTVRAEDFSKPAAEGGGVTRRTPTVESGAAESGGAATAASSRGTPRVAPVTGPIAASEGLRDVTATPGEPQLRSAADEPTAAAEASADPAEAEASGVLVDAVVGQVNGKPIRVSNILEPMGPRLTAISRERGRTREAWRREAGEVIETRVRDFLNNEVLRAEAISSFTPEEKQGFFAWLQGQQRKFESENLGSREVASRRLAKENRTMEDWRQEKEETLLIGTLFREKIVSRVQVTKRDSQLYYDQNRDKFNPPPKAIFRRVSIDKKNAAGVEEFGRRLGAGEAFEALAKSELNGYARRTGGLVERPFSGEQEEGEFFNTKALNEAAQRLKAGEHAGPIELAMSFEWLYLEAIERKAVSWYDAQLDINDTIRAQRLTAVRNRYIDQLLKRGSYTSVEEMVMRLLAIAEDRYYKPGRGGETPARGSAER